MGTCLTKSFALCGHQGVVPIRLPGLVVTYSVLVRVRCMHAVVSCHAPNAPQLHALAFLAWLRTATEVKSTLHLVNGLASTLCRMWTILQYLVERRLYNLVTSVIVMIYCLWALVWCTYCHIMCWFGYSDSSWITTFLRLPSECRYIQYSLYCIVVFRINRLWNHLLQVTNSQPAVPGNIRQRHRHGYVYMYVESSLQGKDSRPLWRECTSVVYQRDAISLRILLSSIRTPKWIGLANSGATSNLLPVGMAQITPDTQANFSNAPTLFLQSSLLALDRALHFLLSLLPPSLPNYFDSLALFPRCVCYM